MCSVAKEGIQYGAGFGAAALLAGYLAGPWWGAPFAVLALFLMYFFRDPERAIPTDPGLVVSPADGKVVNIRQVEHGGRACHRISIFLSPMDVHINRSPVSGVIRDVIYCPGRFHVAWKEEASIENERNTITVETSGGEVVCKQIAGVLARRVVCWKKSGDPVARGERIGLMKFSSRMDVYLDLSWDLAAAAGDRVVGGVTPLARMPGKG
jgi:phosphatidylserine decarboxylase